MESYEHTLPVEQWRQVLLHVSPGGLCNVVLTSRHMNRVASLPELWAGMKVNRCKVGENGLAEFYNINRFKKITEIDFRGWNLKREEWERLLKSIPGSPLKNANLGSTNLTGVSADLLASAVSSLHIANLSRTSLANDQCIAILKASLFSTTLKKLNLWDINLSQVPAELLASSISRLQIAVLFRARLTTNQCVALLKASLSSATLTEVELLCVNLSQVPAELLASSISRLQDVNLCRTRLTTNQCIALMKAICSSTTLTKVNLDHVKISQVPAELLASSISRLQDVNLRETRLTTDQCIALMKAICSSTTLTKVNLEHHDNLSQVPAELLASSISRLQDVSLRGTRLTNDQCIALLNASLSSTTLTEVNLGYVNLSQVPAELLASSISRLQDADLTVTRLTTNQCIALLKAICSSTTLTEVNLEGVNLSQVPAELLVSSISRLQNVNLCRTRLTTNLCIALLKAICSSTTVTKVNLDRVDLSQVPAELLASSISRLKHVKLCATALTTDQSVALLNASLSSTTLTEVNLECVNLSQVPTELLTSSISRLQDVNLRETRLTTDQCIALLKAIFSSTTLTKVNLGHVDLSQVPAELLASSISRLQNDDYN